MGLEGAPMCVAPRVGVPTEGIASLGQMRLAAPHFLLSIPDARGKCRKLCSNWGIVFLGKKVLLSVAVVGTCMSSHSTLCIS